MKSVGPIGDTLPSFESSAAPSSSLFSESRRCGAPFLGTYCDFTEDTCSQPRSTALNHRHSKVLDMIVCWTKIDGAGDENRTRVLNWEYEHMYAIVMA